MVNSNEFIIQLSSSEGGKVIVGGGGESGGESSGSGYVVWDPNMVARGLDNMSHSVGAAFNVGIWVFLGITGLYAMISIIRSLFG